MFRVLLVAFTVVIVACEPKTVTKIRTIEVSRGTARSLGACPLREQSGDSPSNNYHRPIFWD